MEQLISQVLLPVVLALIMLGMGLNLTLTDFKKVAIYPKSIIIGLLLQMLFLPSLALIIIYLLPLSEHASAGLFLVSLCPGGATSNLFSYLAKGDVALSVTLTTITSLISPLSIPIAFASYLLLSGNESTLFSVPVSTIVMQLAVVTLIPISFGMLIRSFAFGWVQKSETFVKNASSMAMITIIMLLLATNLNIVQRFFSFDSLAVLMMSTFSLVVSFAVAKKLLDIATHQITIGIEVGVQNAGTAMMVALTILHINELAYLPLMYGLFMNIPAIAFVVYVNRKIASL